MLKSVYSRIFYFSTIALMFACALTGLAVTLFANRTYERETIEDFDDSAQVILTRIQDLYARNSTLPLADTQSELEDYTLSYNIDCYVFDQTGKCLIRSDFNYTDVSLNQTLRDAAEREPYCQVGGVASNFSEPSARYVEHFELDDDHYYLMLIFPIARLSNFSQRLILVLVITVLLIGLVAAPLFYLNTAQLLRPVSDITHAAEAYAKGDFSVRLSPNGDSELDYLAATMNRMADFIDRNENSRKNFVSNVSHELKTPMTTIGGFVDGILDGTIPQEKEREYLKLVSSEVQRMTRLVHSMLNIAKFEEGALTPNFTQFDLTRLLIKTLFLFEEKVNAKKLSVEGLEDCPRMVVTADRDLMQQVFYNLTENAIKFVNVGGSLSLTVTADDNCAHVQIRNSGEGLTEEEIAHVFERFYKTDASRGKDVSGVGLGLSIVSRIMRLHNGSIAVKSVLGAYTAFDLTLPLTQPASSAPALPSGDGGRTNTNKQKGNCHESKS